MTKPSRPAALLCAVLLLCCSAHPSLRLPERLISDKPVGSSRFPLVTSQRTAPIWYDPNDYKGVIRAIGDLVIVGTLGKSAVIDELVATSKLDVTDRRGKWESFVIATVPAPLEGVKQALVIAGSDKRGTIYGRHSATTTTKSSLADPGIVVEKVVISDRDLPPTYFGPPAMSAVAH